MDLPPDTGEKPLKSFVMLDLSSLAERTQITVSGVPEQSTQESLEGLKNPEVRNLNKKEIRTTPELGFGRDKVGEVNHSPERVTGEASPPATSDPKKDMKGEIGAAVSKSFTNFLKDWVKAVEYEGYCWIPEEDFDLLCEALSGVSTVGCFSMQDKEMVREIDEWGPSDLIHVRVFSTLRDRQGHRTIEVSGTLALGVLLDESGAYMIGGITGEDPIVVKFLCAPPFYEFSKYSTEVEKEFVPLFRIPTQYGNIFMRFTVGCKDIECKEVSRYQAERDLVAAVRRPLPEAKKRGMICDSCGKEAGPDAELTAMLRTDGHYKGTEPLRALDLVSVNGEIQALCLTCSRTLTGKEQAA